MFRTRPEEKYEKRSVIGENCKVNVLQLFNRGIADDGTIYRTKKISLITAMKMLKKKVIDEGWDKRNLLTEKQIISLFSRHKKDRTKRGHKAMKEIETSNLVKEVVNI